MSSSYVTAHTMKLPRNFLNIFKIFAKPPFTLARATENFTQNNLWHKKPDGCCLLWCKKESSFSRLSANSKTHREGEPSSSLHLLNSFYCFVCLSSVAALQSDFSLASALLQILFCLLLFWCPDQDCDEENIQISYNKTLLRAHHVSGLCSLPQSLGTGIFGLEKQIKTIFFTD